MTDSKERLIFSDANRIPVHLISGFLGSGKTTLLQQLLNYCIANGIKPAVMMNEYGEINIDGELLRGQGYSVREMTNGCICCTIGGTLGLAIQDVLIFKPEVIFIEATGLADPVELVDQITKEDVLPFVRLASIIAVVDPINFARLAEEVHSGIRQQTELADVVLINKRDVADEQTLQALAAEVRTLNPRSEILLTERGQMDYARLLQVPRESTRLLTRPPSAPVHDHFHTLTILCEQPFVREQFEHVMRTLPPTVWRAKGFVRFVDSDEQWMFQYVLGDFALEWLDLLPEPPEHVVFIGKGFPREALSEALRAATAPHPLQ
jgi:G3E family GTPase